MILGFGLGDLWLRLVCPSASEFVDLSLTGDFRANLLLWLRVVCPSGVVDLSPIGVWGFEFVAGSCRIIP